MLNILCFMSTNMWKKLKFCQIGLVPFVQYFPLSYENCKKSEINNFLTIFCFKSYHQKRFTERKNLKHFKMGMEIPISSSVLSNTMKTSVQLESGNILNKKAPLAQRILSQILNHFFRCLHALCWCFWNRGFSYTVMIRFQFH